jgi:hypothetical protein
MRPEMYFFVILVVILLITLSYYVTQYKSKAVKSGEADISLTGKNILPFCRTCKFVSAATCALVVLSGTLLIFASYAQINGWSFLDLTKNNWRSFHLIAAVVFIFSFSFHIYIHWNWIKSLIGRKLKPAR